MREVLLTLLAVVLVGLLLYGFIQLMQAAERRQRELERQVQELAARETVTLSDFIGVLGDPTSVSTVTCGQAQCIKAIWNISYPFIQCYKRFIVVLDEAQKRVFLAEWKDLEAVEVTKEGEKEIICIEAP